MTDRDASGAPSGRSAIGHLCRQAWRAPLSVAGDVGSLVPKLARAGVDQLAVARHLGRFALRRDDPAVDEPDDRARVRAQAHLRSLGLVPQAAEGPPATAPSRAATGAAPAEPEGGAPPTSAPAAAPSPAPAPLPAAAPSPAQVASDGQGAAAEDGGAELAIPDYESLSASQVVPRLDGLSGPELEAVRRFEEANRGRRTILSKIAQLQGG